MKLSIRIADPAGNITIFVTSPVEKDMIPQISNQLLSNPQWHGEQVAFVVPPVMGGEARIQMMGGEFCGNATRSFGYLVGSERNPHPDSVNVEISGAPTTLTVSLDYEKGTCSTQMPILDRVETISYQGVPYAAMVFEGIVHIIVSGKPKDETFVKNLIAYAQEEIPSDAYGVMFLDGDHLIPVVYVVNTHSLFWESSCGSGSVASACFLSLKESDGVHHFDLVQPGGTIQVDTTVTHGQITSCQMGGPITLSDEIEVEI